MSTSIAAPVHVSSKNDDKALLSLQVLLFLVGMVALWTVLCAVSHRAPDLDGMEELVWASSLELGYLKHPPVPSWFMYGLTPFVSTIVISGVLGTRLEASWATTFFVLYGFYTLWWMYGNEQSNLRRIVILAVSLHILMAVGYALGRGPLAWYSGRETRSNSPRATLRDKPEK